MRSQGKLLGDPPELGAKLRAARIAMGMTLVQIAQRTGIDVSQLSRFERGDFKRTSRNLQKLIDDLQIDLAAPAASRTSLSVEELSTKATLVAGRSERHRAATEAILLALEQLR